MKFDMILDLVDSQWAVGVSNMDKGKDALVAFLDKNYPMSGNPWQITSGIYKLDTVVFGQSGIWLDTGVDSWKVSKEDANKFRLMLIGLI